MPNHILDSLSITRTDEKIGWENQKVLVGTINDLKQIIEENNIGQPSIIVVGETVKLRQNFMIE